MTDRTNYLTVVLDRDYRGDDIQCVIDAIELLKPVIKVSSNVKKAGEYAVKQQVKYELRNKMFEVLK